jgi:hypothetical protein
VKVEFVEALAPRDTTSSTRYQAMYEETIALATTLLKKRLNACGYEFATKTSFYEATDSLKAKEKGEAAQASGAWLIVGPRRSNHYLLLAQGAQDTPTISLMASADALKELGPLHLSVAPLNSQMAAVAAKETRSRFGKAANYVSVVSSDCLSCMDFAKSFDSAAKRNGLRKIGEVALTGEAFDADAVKAQVQKLQPKFVLLPNYSKVSSLVMAAFNDEPRRPFFVGGDGWGDSLYGFVKNGLSIENVEGITVRGFPPFERGLRQFPLGREAIKLDKVSDSFAPDLSILKILEVTTDRLCKDKPKSRADFVKSFGRGIGISAPWGVSVYGLKNGDIQFSKSVAGIR